MQPTNVGRLLAWAGLVLAALFFLTTGGTYPGIASVDAHLVGQVIGIVVLGGWCVLALVRPAWRPGSPLILPIALASAAYLLSFVFSQRSRLSLEPTIAGLGWALAYVFVARLLAEEWFRARVAVVMTAFTAVVAFGYIGQVLVEWWNWWGLVGHFAVPPLRPSFAALFLGSPNLIGTALILLAPLVVAVAWSRYRRRSIAVAIAVASGLATFLSGSRGAYLAVGVGAILALALALAFAATRGPGARGAFAAALGRIRGRPLLLVPVLAVAAVGLALAPSLLQRFAQGGGTLRVDLWRSALSIFVEHPIFGAGPGTWVQLKVAANPQGVPNLILPHAHDMYVQAAAEVGVVGLLALVILALAVLRRLIAGLRSTDRALSVEAGAVLVSLSAFAVQSIVDNLVNLPFVVLIVITVVAWVDGGLAQAVALREDGGSMAAVRSAPRWRSLRNRGAVVPAVGLLAIALVIPTLLRIDRAAASSRVGGNAALLGHWQVALEAYDLARSTDPGFTLYEIQAAGALARIGRTIEARDLLAHAIESDPVAINVLGLAALEAELGDREQALAHIGQAIALGRGEPVVALNAGLIAERLDDRDLALDQFATAIALDPPLISAGLWTSSSRLASRQELVERARAISDDLTAALILAYAGDPAGARAELERLPRSSEREAYLAATTWLDGDPNRAVADLASALGESPSDWYVAAWAARIGRIANIVGVPDRYSRWAIAVQGDAAPLVIGEGAQVPAGDDAATAALPGTYPWAVYLRPVAPFLHQESLVVIGRR